MNDATVSRGADPETVFRLAKPILRVDEGNKIWVKTDFGSVWPDPQVHNPRIPY